MYIISHIFVFRKWFIIKCQKIIKGIHFWIFVASFAEKSAAPIDRNPDVRYNKIRSFEMWEGAFISPVMQKYLIANYHTHTMRCHHASGDEREYIERAIRSGIRTLGFSDHAPQLFDGGYVSGFRMLPEQTEEYVSTLCALREEYRSDIQILIGYEMEYYPRYFEQSLAAICRYPVDYLIVGQHFLENENPLVRARGGGSDEYSGGMHAEQWKLDAYVDRMLGAIGSGVYSCLAHPDLFRWAGDPALYHEGMLRMCRAARDARIPLELNLLGIIDNRWYPNEAFWRIAGEAGCEAIIGCDAHTPDALYLPQAVEQARDIAQRCGVVLRDTLALVRPIPLHSAEQTP